MSEEDNRCESGEYTYDRCEEFWRGASGGHEGCPGNVLCQAQFLNKIKQTEDVESGTAQGQVRNKYKCLHFV